VVFSTPEERDWGAIMAGSTLMTPPVSAIFPVVRRQLVSGLAGAVR
jgi:N,N'-diacetylchitobiose transport system permease protein